MLPSPELIPADVANQTRVAGASRSDSRTTPTPCTPGTYGVAGAPKYDVPVAQSRSSGVIGAAVTSTSDSVRTAARVRMLGERRWRGPGCG